MNALAQRGIEIELVRQLRLLEPGRRGVFVEIRSAIAGELGACAAQDLRRAIERLRFQGKLHWTTLELAPSMLVDQVKNEALPPAHGAAADGPVRECRPSGRRVAPTDDPAPSSDPGKSNPAGRELYELLRAEGEKRGLKPSRVSMVVFGNAAQMSIMKGSDRPVRQQTVDKARDWLSSAPAATDRAHSPIELGHRRSAASRAGEKLPPAPVHEPEIAKAVREEVETALERGRRASSTATVSRPLEISVAAGLLSGLGPLSLVETVATVMAEEPHDLILAINRRHKAAWSRIIRLARAAGTRPSQALYDVLEAGLAALEPNSQEIAR